MRFQKLDPASQQLTDAQAPAETMFVTVGLYRRYGEAWLSDETKVATIPLDSFVALVADRIVMAEAAAEKPKPKRAVAA